MFFRLLYYTSIQDDYNRLNAKDNKYKQKGNTSALTKSSGVVMRHLGPVNGLSPGSLNLKRGMLILSPTKTVPAKVSCPFLITQPKLRLICVNLRVGWPF